MENLFATLESYEFFAIYISQRTIWYLNVTKWVIKKAALTRQLALSMKEGDRKSTKPTTIKSKQACTHKYPIFTGSLCRFIFVHIVNLEYY